MLDHDTVQFLVINTLVVVMVGITVSFYYWLMSRYWVEHLRLSRRSAPLTVLYTYVDQGRLEDAVKVLSRPLRYYTALARQARNRKVVFSVLGLYVPVYNAFVLDSNHGPLVGDGYVLVSNLVSMVVVLIGYHVMCYSTRDATREQRHWVTLLNNVTARLGVGERNRLQDLLHAKGYGTLPVP